MRLADAFNSGVTSRACIQHESPTDDRILGRDRSRTGRRSDACPFEPFLVPPRCPPSRDSRAGARVCRFHGSLVMKYLARGVPAYFSPITRAKSSTELRGRWFTTRC